KKIDLCHIHLLPRTEKMNSRFTNPDNDPRGPWASGDLVANEERSGGYFDITGPTGNIYNVPKGKHWVYSEENLKKMVEEGRIWFGVNGDAFPRLKRYLTDVQQGRKVDTLWLSNEVGHNQESKREVKALFDGISFFDTPKPVRLLKRILDITCKEDDVILDFFAGSATTAHAIMQLNSEDGVNRKFIMVQLSEECDKKSEAYRAGYKTIAEISKERIRRAGAKILEGECHKDWNKDVGFRVLKVDTSNMADVYYSPDQVSQGSLDLLVDNIKADRTDEDLLFQVLLDWGVDLTLPIKKETIQGKPVFFVDDDALVACFDLRINEALIKELAIKEPLRVVFRDDGFESDAVKINAEQIFKQVSPHTEVKAI
ncbi:TPA: site-specific DNA-methyltransferase, partial [Salmonella enterica subsp. enterica serovar Thompson]